MNGAKIYTLEGHYNEIKEINYSMNSKTLVSLDTSNQLNIYKNHHSSEFKLFQTIFLGPKTYNSLAIGNSLLTQINQIEEKTESVYVSSSNLRISKIELLTGKKLYDQSEKTDEVFIKIKSIPNIEALFALSNFNNLYFIISPSYYPKYKCILKLNLNGLTFLKESDLDQNEINIDIKNYFENQKFSDNLIYEGNSSLNNENFNIDLTKMLSSSCVHRMSENKSNYFGSKMNILSDDKIQKDDHGLQSKEFLNTHNKKSHFVNKKMNHIADFDNQENVNTPKIKSGDKKEIQYEVRVNDNGDDQFLNTSELSTSNKNYNSNSFNKNSSKGFNELNSELFESSHENVNMKNHNQLPKSSLFISLSKQRNAKMSSPQDCSQKLIQNKNLKLNSKFNVNFFLRNNI